MSGIAMEEAMALTYKTYRLDPTSPSLAFFAGKYAALELRALATDPQSFGMSFATEATFTPTQWIKRLSRPNVHVFVCVAHPADLPTILRCIENGDWVGMVTQLGPTPKDAFWAREAGSEEPLDDALETKWHQTATWVDPAHRGRGIAKQLIDAGVAFAAESIRGRVRQARVRAYTGPYNATSKALYAKSGFPTVGLITRHEAMIHNGNAEFQFQDGVVLSEAEMHTRAGVMMERVVRIWDGENEREGET